MMQKFRWMKDDVVGRIKEPTHWDNVIYLRLLTNKRQEECSARWPKLSNRWGRFDNLTPDWTEIVECRETFDNLSSRRTEIVEYLRNIQQFGAAVKKKARMHHASSLFLQLSSCLS